MGPPAGSAPPGPSRAQPADGLPRCSGKRTLPTLTATFGQALRYFLAGAFFLLLVRILSPSAAYRLPVYTDKGADALLFPFFALVLGSIAYCVHRALIYPCLHKFLFWSLNLETWPRPLGWLRVLGRLQWLPWVDLAGERAATIRRLHMHPNPHDHIAGWGAEVHFLYVSTELFLFAILIWPRGWDLAWRTLGGALAVLVLLVT